MKFTAQKKEEILFNMTKRIKYSPDISIRQLSEDIGISRVSCHKYINELKNKGIVYKDRDSYLKLKISSLIRHNLPNKNIDESYVYDNHRI